jgi:hypothetical protein
MIDPNEIMNRPYFWTKLFCGCIVFGVVVVALLTAFAGPPYGP